MIRKLRMRNAKGLSPSDRRKIFYTSRRFAELVILDEIARLNDLAAKGETYSSAEVKEMKLHLHAIRRTIKSRPYPF